MFNLTTPCGVFPHKLSLVLFIPGLKKFSFTTEVFNVGNYAVPDFDRGMKMLVDNCPDLEVCGMRNHLINWT